MPFESEAQAAEALAAANSGAEQAPVETPTDTQVDTGATHEDSFTSIDPSVLPAELQNTYKQMQADYTRKAQEIAPYRKLGATPEEAQQALAAVESLKNPEIQRQLFEELSNVFGGQMPGEDEIPEFDDPRDEQLADLGRRLEGFEQRQVLAEVEARLERDERVLRTENPSWNDDDFETVAQFAIANGGDLLKGAEVFKGLQQRLLKTHLDGKASVPAGTGSPGATGHAEVPTTKFDNIEDAHKAALAYWNANNAQ